jgi:hypothetical protein
MAQTRQEGDWHCNGTATFKTLDIPAGTVIDADVSASASIAYTKMESLQRGFYGQDGTAVSASAVSLGTIRGATGTMLKLSANALTPCVGAATVTIDLKKNGTTMLSSVITLDSGNTAHIEETGTLNVTALAVGDHLTLAIVATAGGGTLPTGLGITAHWKELPS